jgi:hypothetical protein
LDHARRVHQRWNCTISRRRARGHGWSECELYCETLDIGRVQQDVRVNGDSVSAVATDTPTISGTFTTDNADNLPVNTRASFSDDVSGVVPPNELKWLRGRMSGS